MSEPTLTQALKLADAGFHVIPIIPGDKRPPILKWQNHATTDLDTITEWWSTKYTNYGIGVAPRQLPNGRWLFVVDVDEHNPNESGTETLRELEEAYGKLPDTLTCHSGSGAGFHLYFTAPYEIRNGKTARLGPGIDVRGNGGQVCAPPTIHKTGNPYIWDLEHGPDTTEPADAPGWLLVLLAPPEDTKPARTETTGIWDEFDDTPAGIYNRENDWPQLLTADGWTHSHTSADGEQHWVRPGKNKTEGTSATVGYRNLPILKVFTSSVTWLPEGAYSKFKYYACRDFHGDMSQAAKHIIANKPQTINPQLENHWTPPKPLEINPSSIQFPAHTLPSWITNHTKQTADNIQTPTDLTNVLALSALSVACLGNTKISYPRQNWKQPLNLYVATALPPSTGKSPAKSTIFAPLEEYEQQTIQAANLERLNYEQQKRIIEGRRKHNEDKSIRAKGQEADQASTEAYQANLELAKLEPPANGQLILDDTTAEALGVALQQNNGRIAIISAEGGIFDKLAGLYNDQGATNLDLYLEAWSGGRYTVNRIKREPIHIPSANLTISITIQPYTLTQIGANKTFSGRGLLARFLIAYPPSNVGHRDRLRHTTADPQTEQLYNQTLTGIAETNAQQPRMLTLDGTPSDIFAHWDQNLEHQLRNGATLEHIPEFVGKLRANTIRIAGLLHIAWKRPGDHIDEQTIRHAIEIAEYFLHSINHIAQEWEAREGHQHAPRIVLWLKQNELHEFTVSDLHKKFRRQFNKVEDTIGTLEFLTESNYIRPTFAGQLEVGKRGVPSPKYIVNPFIHSPVDKPVDDANGLVVYHLDAQTPTPPKNDANSLVVYHSRMCTDGRESEEVVDDIKRGFLTPSSSIKENSSPLHPPYTCTNGTQLDGLDSPVETYDPDTDDQLL